MPQIDFVIFDCDGVLVDSEYLSAKIGSELLTEAGHAISPEDLSERYAGLVFIDILKEIERESGKPISASILDQVSVHFLKRIETELEAVDGIREAVENVKAHYPYCICSNSNSSNVERMLKITNLYDLFEGKIFSAPEVGTKKTKPAPDVYLFAAQKLGFKPQNTVVIEDSVHGVHGAHAAGMRVIGFTGASHAYPGLADAQTEAGAETVISRHSDLAKTLSAMAAWKDA